MENFTISANQGANICSTYMKFSQSSLWKSFQTHSQLRTLNGAFLLLLFASAALSSFIIHHFHLWIVIISWLLLWERNMLFICIVNELCMWHHLSNTFIWSTSNMYELVVDASTIPMRKKYFLRVGNSIRFAVLIFYVWFASFYY